MKNTTLYRIYKKALSSGTLVLATLAMIALSQIVAQPAIAFACTLPDGSPGVLQPDKLTCCPKPNQDGTQCLYQKYINPAIALLSAAVGIAIAIAIIIGGIEYITSAGDPQRAAAGKKRIVNALIGLIAYALLFTFLQFIIPGGVLNGQPAL